MALLNWVKRAVYKHPTASLCTALRLELREELHKRLAHWAR